MTDADRHWRYALAAMLILASFALGMAVVFHAVPADNQRMVDTLFGGLVTITGNAVIKAIDGARVVEDAKTISQQSAQLADARPADAPSGRSGDPLAVVEESR
jgi:hypothetical protein